MLARPSRSTSSSINAPRAKKTPRVHEALSFDARIRAPLVSTQMLLAPTVPEVYGVTLTPGVVMVSAGLAPWMRLLSSVTP